MKKADYISWCQKQNSNLEKDILDFHKTFPPVFSPTKRVVELDEKGEKIVHKGFPRKLPDWLKPILERVSGRNAYIGRPRTLDDIRILNKSISLNKEGFSQVFPGEPGGRYFESIGKTPAEWAIAFDNLCKKWPRVDGKTLRWGILEPYRPPVLVPPFPSFEIEEWEKRLANLAHGVKIVVPIYEDTSSNDIDWKLIASLQMDYYETKKRATPGKYEDKIRIWETYRKEKNFARVSKELGMHKTTVESIWKATHKDIFDSAPEGTMKERRAIGFDPTSHIDECPICQKAKYNDEEYCSETKAWLNEVYKAQREFATGAGTVEPYVPSRKRPTSDQLFEKEKEGRKMLQKNYERRYKGE